MFHFKKFSIDDRSAAMKIGTDSVLLGAWASCNNETRILDIGAGSGILTLMMAQRNESIPIDAVEVEQNAALLARQNILLSPWHKQIQCFNTSIQEFAAQCPNKYSFIISNPPFFSNSLKSPKQLRNLARHTDTLSASELIQITAKLLTKTGRASFILPWDALEKWKFEARNNSLFPSAITFVKSSPTHPPHRVLITFTSEFISDIHKNELCIYDSERIHSMDYKALTKDFYLNF